MVNPLTNCKSKISDFPQKSQVTSTAFATHQTLIKHCYHYTPGGAMSPPVEDSTKND
jgi:hypothetical protein